MTINGSKRENLISISLLTILYLNLLAAAASAETDENVRVVLASGSIGINERVQFNGLTVKAHEFHDDTVSLAIYRHDNFVELFDYYENDSRQYEDLWVEVFKIEGSSALVAVSMDKVQTVWAELQPVHALWGDYIQKDKYGIEIQSFNNNSVNLIIFADGIELAEERFYQGTDNVYLDDFKIYVSNIDINGNVDLHFFKRMPLTVTGIIKTEKDVYKPDEPVNCRVEILNSGNMTINLADVRLSAEPAGMILIPGYQVNDLLPGQTHIYELPLESVAENEDKTVRINAEITLIDYLRNRYSYTVSKHVYISSGVGIMKEVLPGELEFSDSRTASNAALIRLHVFNVGENVRSIMIHDSIPENVTLYNSPALEWNKEIAPGGVMNLTYYIIPDIPKEYTLPPAEILINGKTIYSTEVLFKVHGPVISLNKVPSKQNGIVRVVNYLKNEGDRAAYVIVIDNLPRDCTMINGTEFWDDVMQPGESGQFSYSMTYSGELDTLPGANVQYQDIKGYQWNFDSNPVSISPDDVNSDISKREIFGFLLSSYLILFLVTGIIMIAIGVLMYAQSR